MTLLDSLATFFSASAANGSAYDYRSGVLARTRPVELPARDLYQILKLFGQSNGLYTELRRARFGVADNSTPIRPIRNPVPQVLEFLSGKTFPNPLEIVTENEALILAIEQIWKWSNLAQSHRLFARYMANYGESYWKACTTPDKARAYLECISPEYVTDFETETRGYLTMIRVDIPRSELRDDGTRRLWTHTELWEQPEQRYRQWANDGDSVAQSVRDLGQPVEDLSLSAFGISFLPWTRVVFQEAGEKRGVGAIQLALEAIIEGDLSATNLHSAVFSDLEGAWVLRSEGVDAAGRPIVAPSVSTASTNGTGATTTTDVTVGKRSFWRLPGNQRLESVVPPIDYAAALLILQDHDTHLEQLMPSLAYSKLSGADASQLSGRAIRYRLSAAIDQVTEVRANALAGLGQANMQALTLGQQAGLFRDLGGTYEDGSFEHSFSPVDILALSAEEVAAEDVQRAAAFSSWMSAGLPMADALIRCGWSETDAIDVMSRAAEMADSGEGEPVEP